LAREQANTNMAICIDARSRTLARFSEILLGIDRMNVDCQIIYLDAQTATLVKRFSETRRRHPLTSAGTDLIEAIEAERDLLEDIADLADLTIDTTLLPGRALSELIRDRIVGSTQNGLSLLFRSFGYKYGVPVDADLVFDVRCLPNPFWEPTLRALDGRDPAIATFLEREPMVHAMAEDIGAYLDRWLPRFELDQRTYMTVAIGCTGGQHRSVYLVKLLAERFRGRFADVLVRHRELAN
ncbi:MAG: RNase adapter RapZ, partial [Pseudomonadales bacterium]